MERWKEKDFYSVEAETIYPGQDYAPFKKGILPFEQNNPRAPYKQSYPFIVRWGIEKFSWRGRVLISSKTLRSVPLDDKTEENPNQGRIVIDFPYVTLFPDRSSDLVCQVTFQNIVALSAGGLDDGACIYNSWLRVDKKKGGFRERTIPYHDESLRNLILRFGLLDRTPR